MAPPAAVAMLDVEGVVVRRGAQAVVDGVALSVAPREIVSLVGPSGCGKTTLLRAIAGLERSAAGRILIAGECVESSEVCVPPEERQVGMVFQEGALFPHLTVLENVRFGVARDAAGRARAARALELVGLVDLVERYPDQLSGGQQQLVGLARALAPAPRIVLLDEPFASLDAALRVRLREQVRTILLEAQATALLVTHDQDEALSLAQRVAVMQRGQLLQVGAPASIYRLPRSPAVAELVGGGALLSCRVASGRLHSPFGSLACDAPDGFARLLVRAEDLELPAAGQSRGSEARLVQRRFYGHDEQWDLTLDTGEHLQMRLRGAGRMPPEAGASDSTRVRVALRPGRLRVFATAAGAAEARTDNPYTARVAGNDEPTRLDPE